MGNVRYGTICYFPLYHHRYFLVFIYNTFLIFTYTTLDDVKKNSRGENPDIDLLNALEIKPPWRLKYKMKKLDLFYKLKRHLMNHSRSQ